MTTPEPRRELEASDHGRFEPSPYDLGISDDPEVTWAEIQRADPEAGLGHDYDGPELRSGTPENEALYAEYQAWAQAEPEPEDVAREAALEAADEWDSADSNAYQARAEAGPEPELEAE